MTLQIWEFVLYLVLALVGGGVAGYFLTRKLFQREMEKNPPINEKMIRAMFLSMGKKPSEKQVNQVLASMNIKRSSDKKK